MYYSILCGVMAVICSGGQGLTLSTCHEAEPHLIKRHPDLEIVDLLAEGMDNLHVEDSNDEEDDLFMTFIATLEMQVDEANKCPAVRKTTALTTEKLIEKL